MAHRVAWLDGVRGCRTAHPRERGVITHPRGSLLYVAFTLGVAACGASEQPVADTTEADYADEIRRYRPSKVEEFPQVSVANGFTLGGEEYWPFKETPPLYPSKIQWGYEAGSEPAKKCMAASKTALIAILQNPPPELVELRNKTGIQSFFQWNNDYTGARSNGMASLAKLWLYEGRLIKWISETKKSGVCRLPEREDLRALARDCLKNYVAGQKTVCTAENTRGLPREADVVVSDLNEFAGQE